LNHSSKVSIPHSSFDRSSSPTCVGEEIVLAIVRLIGSPSARAHAEATSCILVRSLGDRLTKTEATLALDHIVITTRVQKGVASILRRSLLRVLHIILHCILHVETTSLAVVAEAAVACKFRWLKIEGEGRLGLTEDVGALL